MNRTFAPAGAERKQLRARPLTDGELRHLYQAFDYPRTADVSELVVEQRRLRDQLALLRQRVAALELTP